MPIKLNTASGGGVTLSAANTATDKTITVPADDGTMIYANSSGNVGIGTSSPATKLHLSAPNAINTTNTLRIDNPYYNYFDIANNNGALTFSRGTTENARIDSSGNLLVGATSFANAGRINAIGSSSSGNIISNNTAGSGTRYHCVFYENGTERGSITSNGSTTSYVTSSDYRLKENIAPMTGALSRVAALKPCTYTWKATGEQSEGFIAHELAEVVPDAVTGEKDAVNEDGSIKPQGIDTSFLVATLTAAIKEQQQMIETLQAKVAALEAQ